MTAKALSASEFLEQSKGAVILDVRAPIEFLKGHVPGAVNIPLFEDSERAEIGTLFKQQGKDTAVTRGLEIVSPKMVPFVNRVKQLSANKKVLVYCFRGGMRSNSFAWLMNTSGLDAAILKGGYKAYRNYVLDYFKQPKPLVLLGGRTGSGKTDVLNRLTEYGCQTIDLENLAHHKGSAFGSINEPAQDAQQIFENNLFNAFQALDHSKPILLEDESKNIGINKLPHELWMQMKQAPIIKLEIAFELRIQKLVQDYSTTNIEALKKCILKIAQQLGPQHTKQCLHYLDDRNFAEVARLSLLYYDKAYDFMYDHKTQDIHKLPTDILDASLNAQKVKQLIDSRLT